MSSEAITASCGCLKWKCTPSPSIFTTDPRLREAISVTSAASRIDTSAAAERLLDGVMEVVALELRNPPRAVAPDPRQSQDVALADPGADEHRDEFEEAEVLLAHVLLGGGPRETERHVDALQGRERDTDL